MGTERRADLLIEQQAALDSSGAYTGDWIDTGSVDSIRVACWLPAETGVTLTVEEAIGTSGAPWVVRRTGIATSSYFAYGVVNLATRYFRLVISGGPNGLIFRASVRGV